MAVLSVLHAGGSVIARIGRRREGHRERALLGLVCWDSGRRPRRRVTVLLAAFGPRGLLGSGSGRGGRARIRGCKRSACRRGRLRGGRDAQGQRIQDSARVLRLRGVGWSVLGRSASVWAGWQARRGAP